MSAALAHLGRALHGRGPGRRPGRNAWFFGSVGWYERGVAPLLGPFYARVAADVAAALPPPAAPADASPPHPARAAEVAAALPPLARRPLAVLDVGTGPGRLVLEIARQRPDVQVKGVDFSPDMIARGRAAAARRHAGNVSFEVADAARLPYADGSFDLVVSTFSLHHWEAPAAVVAECRRVLRPASPLWVYDVRLGSLAALMQGMGVDGLRREPSSLPIGPVRLPILVRFAALGTGSRADGR